MTDEREVLAAAWRQTASVLRLPDRRATWVVVLAAEVAEPLTALVDRLAAVHAAAPVLGARLGSKGWVPGRPDEPLVVRGAPVESARLLDRFDLAHQPPLRVLVDAEGRRVALAAHHAALDGQSLVAVLTALAGGPVPDTATAAPTEGGGGEGRRRALLRLLRPADPVAASPGGAGEVLAAQEVDLGGPDVTPRLTAAAVAAAAEHNRRRGERWARVGISVGVAGPPGIGNVATHRRVDLAAGQPVEGAVRAAVDGPPAPNVTISTGPLGPLLAPIVSRFSDSLLISNLGRCTIPGAQRIEFYPAPRGRSAVAVGAAARADGRSTVTIRSTRLDRHDATTLLHDIVRRMTPG